MSIRDEELLARLRTLGSRARRGLVSDATDEVVSLLGLPQEDLTPSVRAALRHLIEEVAGLRQELVLTRSRLAELERLANEDSLAPISNRRAFLRDLARTIGYVERYDAACSLLYFDLNGLKAINDTFGHAAGDTALIHVAEVLLTHTRSSDVIGRLGGDEFGVLLTRADENVAHDKAARLAQAVTGTQLSWKGAVIPISVAFGAHRLTAGEDPQVALAAADRAMYRQKRERAAAQQDWAGQKKLGDDVG
jgi:diguanylate cyclase (GGDEF)-like protein